MRDDGGVAGDHHDGHGLADDPADAEHDRGDDAGQARRDDDPVERLPVGGAEGQGALLVFPGTALMASSEMLMIVGRAMKASMIDPARAVSPVGRPKTFLRNGTRIVMPMKPRTTEGMAARTSTQDFRIVRAAAGARPRRCRTRRRCPAGRRSRWRRRSRASEPRISGRMPSLGGSEIGIPESAAEEVARARRSSGRRLPSRRRKTKIRATKTIEAMPLREDELLDQEFLGPSARPRWSHGLHLIGTKSVSPDDLLAFAEIGRNR